MKLLQNVTLFFIILPTFNCSYVIVTYPNQEKDFLEFLTEFEKNSSCRAHPVYKTRTSLLGRMCESFRKSSLFTMLPVKKSIVRSYTFDVSYQPRHISEDEKKTEYEYTSVYIKNELHQLPLFRCLINKELKTFWYATYGFWGNYMYIFKKTRGDVREFLPFSHLELVGLAEPPIQLQQFRNHRHLERYFLNAYRTSEVIPSEKDTLCTLNANQQFRLCCLIHNSLEHSDTAEVHYVGTFDHSCLEQQRIQVHEEAEEEESRKKYLSRDIYANVIVCSFHENETNKKFFLTADPQVKNAIFVLEPGSQELSVTQHVCNVAVLEFASDIF